MNPIKGYNKFARKAAELFAVVTIGVSGLTFMPAPTANAYWPKSLPVCDDQRVISKIIYRYNKADRKLWKSGNQIYKISGIHLHSVNPFPESLINRRYCHATAILSTGVHQKIHFLVEEGMGLAGFHWNVEYCLKGSDRWHAYDGWCRVLRY